MKRKLNREAPISGNYYSKDDNFNVLNAMMYNHYSKHAKLLYQCAPDYIRIDIQSDFSANPFLEEKVFLDKYEAALKSYLKENFLED